MQSLYRLHIYYCYMAHANQYPRWKGGNGCLVTFAVIDRGPLAKIISFRGTHVGTLGLWFIWKTYRFIATKKSSQAKNLPDTEQTGEFWFFSIKLYYNRKIRNFEVNNNKHDLHH